MASTPGCCTRHSLFCALLFILLISYSSGDAAGSVRRVSLYISEAGSVTNLHYDEGDAGALLCQLAGRKRFLLWKDTEDTLSRSARRTSLRSTSPCWPQVELVLDSDLGPLARNHRITHSTVAQNTKCETLTYPELESLICR